MSERVTVQGKTGRTATTNPLDERIIHTKVLIGISERAPLDLL